MLAFTKANQLYSYHLRILSLDNISKMFRDSIAFPGFPMSGSNMAQQQKERSEEKGEGFSLLEPIFSWVLKKRSESMMGHTWSYYMTCQGWISTGFLCALWTLSRLSDDKF